VAVYIAVFVVVVLGLLLAWRGLGTHASRVPLPLDVRALAATLEQAVDLLAGPEPRPRGAAQQARRIATAASLRLAQAAPAAGEAAAAATALLSAAAEDCLWAARLQESPGYSGNSGLEAGAAALLGHARRCLDAVREEREDAVLTTPVAPPVG
jgi:hypothetical protein